MACFALLHADTPAMLLTGLEVQWQGVYYPMCSLAALRYNVCTFLCVVARPSHYATSIIGGPQPLSLFRIAGLEGETCAWVPHGLRVGPFAPRDTVRTLPDMPLGGPGTQLVHCVSTPV